MLARGVISLKNRGQSRGHEVRVHLVPASSGTHAVLEHGLACRACLLWHSFLPTRNSHGAALVAVATRDLMSSKWLWLCSYRLHNLRAGDRMLLSRGYSAYQSKGLETEAGGRRRGSDSKVIHTNSRVAIVRAEPLWIFPKPAVNLVARNIS